MRKLPILLVAVVFVAVLVAAALLATSAPALSAPLKTAPIIDVKTSFSASEDGFAFINHAGAERGTLLGSVFAGLCGGMSYAALDYFHAAQVPPPGGIDRFLLARDVQSMTLNGPTFAAWTLAPDLPGHRPGFTVAVSTRKVQVPRLDAALKKGPVPLGLVKATTLRDIGKNHQVVAYSLERKGEKVRVGIYDPNHPQSDDAYLELDLSRPSFVMQYAKGRPVDVWRGFFVERYSPVSPPRS